ncbi:MAG: T9SS type A sorting domain-containing protein [Acidobacteriota bacterium]
MRKLLLFMLLMLVLTVSSSYSQISNLSVLGKPTGFTVTSGDNFGWSFNVPNAGDTTLVQIWLDADQNGVINPSVDVLWTFFNQIDGDPRGQNGPPDVDGTANKTVSFLMPLGLAPAHYVLLFRNHGHYTTAAGVVNHMASPVYKISGTVTVPAGMSRKNIVMSLEAENKNGSGTFWDAVTDENGNYTIEMNADTAGNPWTVRPNNAFIMGAAVLSPMEKEMVISPKQAAYTGNNFTFTAPSASVSGRLKDDAGNPVLGSDVSIMVSQGAFYRYGQTDTAGVFHLGLLANEVPQTSLILESHSRDNNNVLNAYSQIASISAGNNITRDLIIFSQNATIKGKVTIDGHAPGFMVQLSCLNSDSLFANLWTDTDGNFTANVTSKVYDYLIYPVINYMNGGTSYNFKPLTAHPGQAGLVLNLSTTTDVKKESNAAPSEFSLSQNYPNPFNPSTTIKYSVAKDGFVSLTVYNLIGSRVATLVSEYKPAGQYSAHFDASSLPSGIYLYKLQSGNVSAYKKLILMK